MGATALLLVVENGHKNVVDVLLKHGADVSTPLQQVNPDHKAFNVMAGDTPLHVASRLGNTAVVRRLIAKNADIEALNSQQQTPVDVAHEESRYADELKLLYYSKKVERLPDNYYEHSLGFFSKKISAAQIRAATSAFKSVIFGGANQSCLKAHQDALNTNELKPLCQRLYRKHA